MKKLFTLSLSILFYSLVQAQNFQEHIYKADSLYKAKSYQASGEMYANAFKQKEGTATQYYNAACSWAKADNQEEALLALELAAQKGYINREWIENDKDLVGLHETKEWKKVIKAIQANLNEYEKDFDKPLQKKLEAIYTRDQTLRQLYQDAEEKFGKKSKEMDYFWDLMSREDKENEAELLAIIDKRGWPGIKLVGGKANMGAFLVIQHASLKLQEKYLPVLEESVMKKQSSGRHLAMLQDRVLMYKGKPQIYGTQYTADKDGNWKLHKIKDPEYVNARRKKIGLGPLENTLKRRGIEFNVEQKSELN